MYNCRRIKNLGKSRKGHECAKLERIKTNFIEKTLKTFSLIF